MPFVAAHLWLIPGLPLAAAAVTSLAPRKSRAFSAALAIAAMAGALLLSCAALRVALAEPSARLTCNFDWFDLGFGALRLGWLLDPLAALVCTMVSSVGLLIFVFSIGYMREDSNFARFFCFLSLFAAGMFGLVLANSLLLLFAGWEIVGLASYLLIGFWFERPAAAAAAKKAFIATRIGDLGLLLGILWLYDSTGSLLFYDGGRGCLEAHALWGLAANTLPCGLALPTAISLLIFCGAIGKSGQFPLHVWLPDAMEGPSPVSALIHAATMVAAGVFLLARVFPLFAADQPLSWVPFHALTVVAGVGAITALLGASIAVAQTDIKRVLAFSTISQLGFMMLAVGVGAWTAAIFHLLTHAFFKALLFLGAGAVINSAHHEQDIRKLGGLAGRLKFTFAAFLVGAMALAGVPLLFSGFWSKEGILGAAASWSVSSLPLLAGLAATALTAFYMTRLVAETFFGPARSEAAAHAREPSAVITLPLGLLSVGAIGLGFFGTPAWPWLQARLAGIPVVSGPLFERVGIVAASTALVAAGIAGGWALYVRRCRSDPAAPDPLAERWPALFRALAGRLWFDEFYAATFGRLVAAAASVADWMDRWIWDGAVRLAAGTGRVFGFCVRAADEHGLNSGFDSAGDGLRGTGRAYSRRQTGEAHGYLRSIAIGFVLLVIAAFFGLRK